MDSPGMNWIPPLGSILLRPHLLLKVKVSSTTDFQLVIAIGLRTTPLWSVILINAIRHVPTRNSVRNPFPPAVIKKNSIHSSEVS